MKGSRCSVVAYGWVAGVVALVSGCARTDGASAPAHSSSAGGSGTPVASGAGEGGSAGAASPSPDVVPSFAASVENTGADCVVPSLPEPGQLPK